MSRNTRPRVLILVKGLGLGGVERLLADSIPYLDRDRFDYEVAYFTPWKNDMVPAFEKAGIPVFCLEIRNEARPGNLIAVSSFLREHSYDLIHTHSPFPSAIARIVAPRDTLAGFIHTEHSLPGSRNLMTRAANRATYPAVDVVITVSRALQDAVNSGRFLRPRSTRLVYGGIDEKELDRVTSAESLGARRALDIPADHSIVGNVAHLRAQKGLDVWLDAARVVLDARPATTFVLVGREKEPGYREKLEEHARSLGIADRVRFAGFQPRPYPFVAAFDVFLMSSAYEGFPIALVEAMALGVPVVSTDVGGVAEALGDDLSDFVAESGDSEALAGRVLELLADERTRSIVGEKARARARSEFTVEHMVKQVEQVYHDLLGP